MFAIVAIVLAMMPLLAQAETVPGPFKARYVSCYDGDTCRFDLHVWLGLTMHTSVRLRGVDTPEIAGACDVEKKIAVAARDFMRAKLVLASSVWVLNVEDDKFGGRVLADLMIDGRSAATLLIDAGLARPYDGGIRQSWC